MKYKLDGQEPVPQLKGAYCLVSQPQAWVWIMLPFKKIKINAKWMLSFNAFASFSSFFYFFFYFYSYDTWILASCSHYKLYLLLLYLSRMDSGSCMFHWIEFRIVHLILDVWCILLCKLDGIWVMCGQFKVFCREVKLYHDTSIKFAVELAISCFPCLSSYI